MTDIFVGREPELNALRAAFERASGGRSELVMLVGEPGAGKTRLAEHWAEEGAARAQVLWARCYDNQGTPPFWLWTQPLRAYLRQLEDTRMAEVVGDAAPVLINLIPELASRLAPTEPATPLGDTVSARFRLYDAVTGLIERASLDQPLVIILDDLHAADAPSLLLLEYLARELRSSALLIVGTYRDVELRRTHPLARTLGELAREQLFQRVPVRRLAESEVSNLAQAIAGRPLSADLAAAVYERSEGNPLFVTELARLLLDSDDDPTMLRQRLPEGVREVIGGRLDELSASCITVLRWAALLGTSCTVALLTRLHEDAGSEQIMATLAEAVAAGVLAETDDIADGYRFTHALIQATIVDELLVSEQVRMHAAIAQALETSPKGTEPADPAQLAYHYVRATPILGREAARSHCAAAGHSALQACGYEAAREWYQRGADLDADRPLDDVGARILHGLASSQAALLVDSSNPMPHLLHAFHYYMTCGNHEAAVEVATVTEWLGWSDQSAGLNAMVEQALEVVPRGSLAEARLQLSHASALYYELGRLDAAAAAVGYTEKYATKHASRQLLARCWLVRGELALWELDHRRARECLTQALSLAEQIDDVGLQAWIYGRGAIAYQYVPGAGAEQFFNRALALTERVRGRSTLVVLHMWYIRLMHVGQWEAARQVARRGLRHYKGYRYPFSARADWLTGMPLTRVWPAVDEYFAAHGLVVRSGASLNLMLFMAEVSYETDDTSHLPLCLEIGRALVAREVLSPTMELPGRLAFGIANIAAGDIEAARRQYRRLSEMPRPQMEYHWSVDRLLGVLASATGDAAAAQLHFAAAERFLREASWSNELGWTCINHATLLRDQLNDDAAAASRLREAQRIANELQMKPLLDRCEQESKSDEAQAARPAGLTEREVTVLELVAQGMPNKEVAAELGIASKTVAVHLRNIFEKTGARSRTEAALFATRHGLVT